MNDFEMFTLYWLIGIVVAIPVLAIIAWAFGILRIVIVQEATAASFKYLGKRVYTALEFTGYHFRPDMSGFICCDDTINPKENRPINIGGCWCIWRIGGWIFYLWPLVSPAKYESHNDPTDGFGGGVLVQLNDVTSDLICTGAQTKDPENVNLDVVAKVTRRVVNPIHYLYISPRDVARQTIDRLDAVLRAWIKCGFRQHAQEARGDGVRLWNELVQENDTPSAAPIFDGITERWGMEIQTNSIVILKISEDSAYTAALKAKSEADLLAQAEAARLGGPVKIMMDQWVKDEAARLGVTEKVAVKALKKSGAYDRKEQSLELLRAQGLAGGNYSKQELDISSGGKPIDPNYAAILGGAEVIGGALGRGRGKQGGRGGRGQGSGAKPVGGQEGEASGGQPSPSWLERHKGEST